MSQKDKRPPGGVGAGNAAFGKAAFSGAHYTTVQAALSYIPADDRNTWLRMGMAVKSELGDGGFDLWDEWNRTADNYDPKAARNHLALHHARRGNHWHNSTTKRSNMSSGSTARRDHNRRPPKKLRRAIVVNRKMREPGNAPGKARADWRRCGGVCDGGSIAGGRSDG
jgi:Primase C terminal 2 (PriCT-2)